MEIVGAEHRRAGGPRPPSSDACARVEPTEPTGDDHDGVGPVRRDRADRDPATVVDDDQPVPDRDPAVAGGEQGGEKIGQRRVVKTAQPARERLP